MSTVRESIVYNIETVAFMIATVLSYTIKWVIRVCSYLFFQWVFIYDTCLDLRGVNHCFFSGRLDFVLCNFLRLVFLAFDSFSFASDSFILCCLTPILSEKSTSKSFTSNKNGGFVIQFVTIMMHLIVCIISLSFTLFEFRLGLANSSSVEIGLASHSIILLEENVFVSHLGRFVLLVVSIGFFPLPSVFTGYLASAYPRKPRKPPWDYNWSNMSSYPKFSPFACYRHFHTRYSSNEAIGGRKDRWSQSGNNTESTLLSRTRLRTNWYRVNISKHVTDAMGFPGKIWKAKENAMPNWHTYRTGVRRIEKNENNSIICLLACKAYLERKRRLNSVF